MSSATKPLWSYGLYALKIAVGVALTIYVFTQHHIEPGDLFGPHALSLLLVLLIFETVIFLLSSIRWVIIARGVASQDLTIKDGILICWIGQFFSSFLPGIIAADVSRYYYVNRIHPGWSENARTIIWDRVIAFISLAVLCLTGCLAYWQGWPLAGYGLLALAGFTAVVLIISRHLLTPGVASRVFVISFCTFSLKAFSLFYVFSVLNPGHAGASVYYLSMMGQIFEAIPLTPANLGVGHYVYDALYGLREGVMGAVIYNYYFMAKLLVKLSGGIGWVVFRPPSP